MSPDYDELLQSGLEMASSLGFVNQLVLYYDFTV